MPGNRKQKHKTTFSKPPGSPYIHPSLSQRSELGQTPQEQPSTVNARIEFLRRTQSPRHALTSAELLDSTHTPPSLASSRHAPLQLRRRVAGPPPPRSWIEDANDPGKRYGQRTDAERRYPPRLDYSWTAGFPEETSLLHQGLKALAQRLNWHLEYDHVFLSLLPVHMKQLLFSYIARYGPPDGLSPATLRIVTGSEADTNLPDSTGCSELQRLDLAGSVGRGLPLKALSRLWTLKPASSTASSPQPAPNTPPDSWDFDEPTASLSILTLSTTLRFPSLTHLSLSHPHPTTSWSDLLAFSSHLTNLTHLSLAHWPSPASTPSIQQNPTDLRPSNLDPDGTATGVYRVWKLSKATSRLRHLDLRGCHAWYYILMSTTSATSPSSTRPPADRSPHPRRAPRAPVDFDDAAPRPHAPTELKIHADWASAWRQLTLLDLAQDDLPPGIRASILASLFLARGRIGTYAYPAAVPPGPPAADEQYRIVAPDARVAEQVAQRLRARQWVDAELEGTRLERWVRGQQRAGRGARGGGWLEVRYGWDKEVLVEKGYDEAALFEAGL